MKDRAQSAISRQGPQTPVNQPAGAAWSDSRSADGISVSHPAVADLETLGQYKLLAKLGEGGMGAVYLALHTRLNKHVALKVLSDSRMGAADAVARFKREMRAVGSLDHPHIVRAMDAGEHEGTYYLVMELVQGLDVGEVLRRLGPLPLAEACEIVRQAAAGLQHAHENGLVHRDIKPSNLMLASQPHGAQLKILDLGLALLEERHQAASGELTSSGQIMGTIDYMAPEQADDTHTVDIRADIYALGASLHKLLTGHVPFHGAQYRSTARKLLALTTQAPPRIDTLRDDLPPQVVEVIHRMLARQPEQRYPTPQAVADALAPFAAGADLQGLLDAVWDGEEASGYLAPQSQSNTDTGGGTSDALEQRVLGSDDSAVWNVSTRSQTGLATLGSSPPWYRRKAVLASLAAVPLLIFLVVVLLRTPHGEVLVEMADDISPEAAQGLKIEIVGDGALKVVDARAGWTINVAEGAYQVRLAGGADRFQLDRNQVSVVRDQRVLLKVSLRKVGAEPPEHFGQAAHLGALALEGRAPAQPTAPMQPPAPVQREAWKPSPEQQAFFDHVATLPADKQAQAVADKLAEVNPGFGGKYSFTELKQQVVYFRVDTTQISDIWPLRALDSLTMVECYGGSMGKLTSLAPLAGMNLTKLRCNNNPISDLSPLEGMPLELLNCSQTNVEDLTPLRGLPLRAVIFRFCPKLKDLSPLQGMKLVSVTLESTPVADLTPLAGMPLESLNIMDCRRVTDLSPLQGMPLTSLVISRCGAVTDFSPLAGMPLEVLLCNDMPISDLSVLKGMPLMFFEFENTSVSDLSPLERLPIQRLNCSCTAIIDYSPLRRLPLQMISTNLRLFDEAYDEVIRSLKLEQIHVSGIQAGYIPVAQYWSALHERRKAAHEYVREVESLSAEARLQHVKEQLDRLNAPGNARLAFAVIAGQIDNVSLSIRSGLTCDISPLMAATDLKWLIITGGHPSQDLSCLKFLPLVDLSCPEGMARSNAGILSSIPTLKTINGQPVAEFLASATP